MGSSIALGAEIKEWPFFPHNIKGVFISNNAIIGKNCTIYQQVTIGSNPLKTSKRFGAPTIGDNCILGVGAKVIGNVQVGNNVRIGANAVISKDVPDGSTVVLSSLIIYDRDKLESEYVMQELY